MPGYGFRATSRRIQSEKSAKHIGLARIKLSTLDFPNSRDLDLSNVDRLKKLFRGQRGFKPNDLENHIPAVIDDVTLNEALNISGLPREALASEGPEYPKLEFPPGVRLECLRGQHRVKAAEETFTSVEIYWVVDLFLSDITDDTKRDLVEEYASEKRPDDGQFYWKIRVYQGVFGEANPYFESRWWARLAAISAKGSANPKNRLEQLLGHRKFAPAFDAFRYLPALYRGLRLSAVNKMVSMRCDEELLLYLRHVRDFWYSIFDGNEIDMQKLDAGSVSVLQSRAPGACHGEARSLYGRICAGEILSAFSAQQRETLWTRICSATLDCLVPSLEAFFDDLKHLTLVADSMRWLLHLSGRDTIRSAFELSFSAADDDDGRCLIQTTNGVLSSISAEGADRFDVAYRVLWLFAFREYLEIPAIPNKRLAGPRSGQVNEMVLLEFASLAQKLGFRSEHIQHLLHKDADRDIARRLLLTARQPDRFSYHDLENCITKVTEFIKSAQAISGGNLTEDDIPEEPGGPESRGIPKLSDHKRDKPILFLDKLHASVRCRSTITSFFIQRSKYFAFFGHDLGINIAGVDAVQNEGITLDINQHLRFSDSREREVIGESLLDAMIIDGTANEGLQQNLGQLADERKARLESLAQQQKEKEERLEQLLTECIDAEQRLNAAQGDCQELQGRLERMKTAEAEQVHRLESLHGDEENRKRHNLGEGIRFDHIAAVNEGRATSGEEVQTPGLQPATEQDHRSQDSFKDLESQVIAKQAALDKLLATERQKEKSIEDLKEEERMVKERSVQALEQARQEEQVQNKEWVRQKALHQDAIEHLLARKEELQRDVVQLETKLNILQGNIDKASSDERDRSLTVMETEQQLSHPPLSSNSSHDPTPVNLRTLPSISNNERTAPKEGEPSHLDAGSGLEKLIRAGLDSDENFEDLDDGVPGLEKQRLAEPTTKQQFIQAPLNSPSSPDNEPARTGSLVNDNLIASSQCGDNIRAGQEYLFDLFQSESFSDTEDGEADEHSSRPQEDRGGQESDGKQHRPEAEERHEDEVSTRKESELTKAVATSSNGKRAGMIRIAFKSCENRNEDGEIIDVDPSDPSSLISRMEECLKQEYGLFNYRHKALSVPDNYLKEVTRDGVNAVYLSKHWHINSNLAPDRDADGRSLKRIRVNY